MESHRPDHDLDLPPAGWAQPQAAPDLSRRAFAAAMVGFVVLVAGSLLGRATTQLAVLLCAVGAAAASVALLPRRWVGHAIGLAYLLALGTLLLS